MSIPRAQVRATSIVDRIRNAARTMRKAKLTPVQEAVGPIQIKADPPKPPRSIFDAIAVFTNSMHWIEQPRLQHVFKCKTCGYENRVNGWLGDDYAAEAVHKFKHNDGCPRIERPFG